MPKQGGPPPAAQPVAPAPQPAPVPQPMAAAPAPMPMPVAQQPVAQPQPQQLPPVAPVAAAPMPIAQPAPGQYVPGPEPDKAIWGTGAPVDPQPTNVIWGDNTGHPPAPVAQPPMMATPPGYAPAPAPMPMPAPAPGQPDMGAQMSALMSGAAPGFGGNGGFMDLGSLDLGAIDDSISRLLDPNIEYEGVITKVEPTKVKGTNAPMLAITIKTTFPQQFANVRLFDNITFGDTALWKLKSLARACDLLTPDGKRILPGTSPQSFVDYVVRFKIKHNTYTDPVTGDTSTNNKIASGYSEGYESPGLQQTAPQAMAPQPMPTPVPMAGVPTPNWGPPPQQ